MKSIFLILSLLISSTSFALSWTPTEGRAVGVINPAGLGTGKAWITLKDTTFIGCTREDGVIIDSAHPDYKEIFSILLAAKMANNLVRVQYSSDTKCSFSEITSAYIL